MRIGMKLDADFDRSAPYQRLYDTTDVPTRLRDLGVEAVEIPLRPESDLEHVSGQARWCQRAGLRVSFHPYSEQHAANPAHFTGQSSAAAATHARFLAIAGTVAADQGDTVVNIHPAAVRQEGWSRRTLVERSVAFFEWARSWCDAHAGDVRPVAELQVAPFEDEPVIRIGDDPAELAEVIAHSGVGACWDVGHAVWNHRRFATEEEPDAALLARIAHVHCHDVADTDHHPPRHGDAPWQRFIRRLAATGYERTVIIEVAPGTFIDAGGMPAVEEAIAAVRTAALT
ncbi:MAG TPA: TIM barrel protein [Euzebyales bacterium]|nr:TIM barrel protein [Euzebyales bacterium]